ncbi:Tetratricopeptide repeat,Tetratricopeptide repeat 1,Tetratricopeptide repeat-containing [Cinara cedri]|uniref:Tetratricopeptide repeat,Tetratricopeptide repeat 1,Tetratricopeptide repeat-containing n=1 Tax=Cinara cedri TaxID=506608 RepID=A0A5E4N2J6_9HEMI|nr:Tetratricopeptide repeat,Tetratricopeptide repeat 1,Tetratricopeptide repeat-containing [Cinara cedri]
MGNILTTDALPPRVFWKQQSRIKQINDLIHIGEVECDWEHFSSAILFFKKALSMCFNSDSKEYSSLKSIIYYNRAIAYFRQSNYEDCLKDCEKALELEPNHTRSFFPSTEMLNNRQKYLSGIARMALIRADGRCKDHSLKLLKSQVVIQSSGPYLEMYDNINLKLPSKSMSESFMNSFADSPFNDEFAQSLLYSNENTGLEAAMKCVANGDYQEALYKCLDEINKTNSNNVRQMMAHNIYGTICIMGELYDIGLLEFSKILTLTSDKKMKVDSLIKRALIHMKLKHIANAFRDLQTAKTEDPLNGDNHVVRANLFIRLQNFEKAAREMKKALKKKPKFLLFEIKYLYAEYLYVKNSFNQLEAKNYINELKKLAILYVNVAEVQEYYGRALIDNGEHKNAMAKFENAIKNHPKNTNLLVLLAKTQLTLHKFGAISYENAEIIMWDTFDKILKVDSNCDSIYETMSDFYSHNNKHNEAANILKHSVNYNLRQEQGEARVFNDVF